MENRPILYLANTYIATHQQLKDIVTRSIDKEKFRKELLSAFRDHLLEDWMHAHNIQLDLPHEHTLEEIGDSDLTKVLCEAITGKESAHDFTSDFSKLATFDRCLVDDEEQEYKNGVIAYDPAVRDTEVTIQFVFKSLKVNNDEVHLSLIEDENELGHQRIDWRNMKKDKECSVEFNFNVDTYQLDFRKLSLVEGGSNKLLTVEVCPVKKVKCEVEGKNYDFFFIKEKKFFVFKAKQNALTPVEKKKVLNKLRNYNLRQPTEKEARVILKDVVFSKIWLKDGRFIDYSCGSFSIVSNIGYYTDASLVLISDTVPVTKYTANEIADRTFKFDEEGNKFEFMKVTTFWASFGNETIDYFSRFGPYSSLKSVYNILLDMPNVQQLMEILVNKPDLALKSLKGQVWINGKGHYPRAALKDEIFGLLKNKTADEVKEIVKNTYHNNPNELFHIFDSGNFGGGNANLIFIADSKYFE